MKYIFGSFDYETTMLFSSTEFEFRLVSLILLEENAERSYIFYNNVEFVNFILNHPNKMKLWAHNLKFDIRLIVSALPSDWEYDTLISGSRLIRFRIFKSRETLNRRTGLQRYRKDIKVEFRDSQALFPTTLAKIGAAIGLPKLEIDLETEDLALLAEYCKRDSEIVIRSLLWFTSELSERGLLDVNLSSIPLTISSLALKIFKRVNATIEKNVFIPMEQDNFFRNTYFGGRVEVFDYNPTHVNYWDVNSLYPAVMSQNLFGLPPYTYSRDFGPLTLMVKASFVDFEDFPLIPERIGQSVYFRSGLKSALIHNFEFNVLQRDNRIQNVEFYVNCSKFVPIFAYISELYSWRQHLKSLNDGFEKVLKFVMNTTYGKFGQKWIGKRLETLSVERAQALILQGHDNVHFNVETQTFWREIEEIRRFQTVNCQIASRVTALARFTLWNGLVSNSNACYCDTDSIVLPQTLSPNLLVSESELGQWKLEWSDYVHFIAPKFYLKSSEWTCKGIPKRNLTLVRQGSEFLDGIAIDRIHSFKSAVKKTGRFKGCERLMRKHRQFIPKRVILDSGQTRPYNAAEEPFEQREKIIYWLSEANLEI